MEVPSSPAPHVLKEAFRRHHRHSRLVGLRLRLPASRLLRRRLRLGPLLRSYSLRPVRRHRPGTTGVRRLINISRNRGFVRVWVEVAHQQEAE